MTTAAGRPELINMNRRTTTWHRSRSATLACLVAVAFTMSFAPVSAEKPLDNQGTIKVHDNETADPEVRNEPHVSCDFWIEGFNMEQGNGTLVFNKIPPGDKIENVTPSGDGLDWQGTPEGDQSGGYHFLNGPYQLPAGHYDVQAYSSEGHPGNAEQFSKKKVFWVDECAEIPVFPTVLASTMAIGLAVVGYAVLRRS